MRERSRAKSSAAKTRPERRGEAAEMEWRLERALADSISASILMGWGSEGGGSPFWGERWCARKSVTQWRSDAEFTFGTTMVSRCGALHCRVFE